MEISPLALKGIAYGGTTTAVVAPTVAGIVHRDKISEYFSGKENTDASKSEGKAENSEDNSVLREIGEKVKALGFEANCTDSSDGLSKTYTLNKDKLKTLVFLEGTNTDMDVTPENASASLKVEKINQEFKFTLTNKAEAAIEIKKGTAVVTSLKKDVGHSFKDNGSSKLEKIWEGAELGEKMGLSCSQQTGKEVKCKPKEGGTVNVIEGTNKLHGATWPGSEKEKTFKLEKSQDKFTFTAESEISLNGGTKVNGSSQQIQKLANTGKYEIKFETDKWYMVKKTS